MKSIAAKFKTLFAKAPEAQAPIEHPNFWMYQ